MPRIRTVKPEFWTSGQVLECSTNARLLFIGLWNFCDDTGRHPFRPKQIKAEVFPADDFTAEDILGLLQELSENDLITTYVVDGKEFLQVNGWHHQRIDKPQPSKYPGMDKADSATIPRTLPPDRKGRDRKGGKDANASLSTPDGEDGEDQLELDGEPKKTGPPPCNHQAVLEIYNQILPELRTALLDRWPGSQGETWLRARWRENQKHQDLDWWREFFRVVRTNPHWMGDNDRGWKADLRWLLKRENFDKVVERWASLGEAA